MAKQFLTQSVMQSATAEAARGEDSIVAPMTTAPIMEANDSRRDKSIEPPSWLVHEPCDDKFVVVLGAIWFNDSVVENENPSTKRRKVTMSTAEVMALIIITVACRGKKWFNEWLIKMMSHNLISLKLKNRSFLWSILGLRVLWNFVDSIWETDGRGRAHSFICF